MTRITDGRRTNHVLCSALQADMFGPLSVSKDGSTCTFDVILLTAINTHCHVVALSWRYKTGLRRRTSPPSFLLSYPLSRPYSPIMSVSSDAVFNSVASLKEEARQAQEQADRLKARLAATEQMERQEVERKRKEAEEAEKARARKKANNQAAATQRGTAFVIIFFLVLMNA